VGDKQRGGINRVGINRVGDKQSGDIQSGGYTEWHEQSEITFRITDLDYIQKCKRTQMKKNKYALKHHLIETLR